MINDDIYRALAAGCPYALDQAILVGYQQRQATRLPTYANPNKSTVNYIVPVYLFSDGINRVCFKLSHDLVYDEQDKVHRIIRWLPIGFAWWIIIAEDGDGKVHQFKALCDDSKPDNDPLSIYSAEERIRKDLSALSGHIIYSYRERDIIEDCTLRHA